MISRKKAFFAMMSISIQFGVCHIRRPIEVSFVLTILEIDIHQQPPQAMSW